jgi:hypothetical protein
MNKKQQRSKMITRTRTRKRRLQQSSINGNFPVKKILCIRPQSEVKDDEYVEF